MDLLTTEITEVKIEIVKSLNSFFKVIGTDLLGSSLWRTIQTLSNDAQWRVRLSVLDLTLLIGSESNDTVIDKENFSNFEDIFFARFQDTI